MRNGAKSGARRNGGRSLVQIYALQGGFMAVVALPILCCPSQSVAIEHPLWLWVRFLGFLLFLGGFVYESIADWQLLQFTKSVHIKGEIMQTGLWAYSRHPNYFGEIVVWWGIFLIGFPYGSLPLAALALLSPLTMTWLLTRVSGVPMLERRWTDNAEYAAYIKRTNALMPDFFND